MFSRQVRFVATCLHVGFCGSDKWARHVGYIEIGFSLLSVYPAADYICLPAFPLTFHHSHKIVVSHNLLFFVGVKSSICTKLSATVVRIQNRNACACFCVREGDVCMCEAHSYWRHVLLT